jgi:hypothetical protein
VSDASPGGLPARHCIISGLVLVNTKARAQEAIAVKIPMMTTEQGDAWRTKIERLDVEMSE